MNLGKFISDIVDLVKYDIPRFLSNLYFYRKTLWGSRGYDYSGAYLALRDTLQKNVDYMDKYSYHTTKDKSVREMKTCIHLLDRLIKSDYQKVDWVKKDFKNPDAVSLLDYFEPVPRYQFPSKTNCKREVGIEKYDKELLFKLLNKHLTTWWY